MPANPALPATAAPFQPAGQRVSVQANWTLAPELRRALCAMAELLPCSALKLRRAGRAGEDHPLPRDVSSWIALRNGGVAVEVVPLEGNDCAMGKMLATLAPALRQLLEQDERHQQAQREVARLQAALDTCAHGILLIGRDEQVLNRNTAAQALLDDGRELACFNGRLLAADPSEAMRLDVLLRAVLSGQRRRATTSLSRPCRSPLILTIKQAAEGVAAIQITDPDADAELPLDALANFFQLAPTERRLVERLALSDTLRSAANVLGVKEQTARKYCKQIFEKTGLHRQPDLIRLVLNAATPRLAGH